MGEEAYKAARVFVAGNRKLVGVAIDPVRLVNRYPGLSVDGEFAANDHGGSSTEVAVWGDGRTHAKVGVTHYHRYGGRGLRGCDRGVEAE